MNRRALCGLFSAVSLIGFAAGAQAADQQQSEVYNCNMQFESGSDQVAQEDLQRCLEQMQGKNISFIHVMTAASPDGDAASNKALSDRRALLLRDQLLSQFQGTRIEAMGVGENETLGRSARIVAVVAAPTTTAATEQPLDTTESTAASTTEETAGVDTTAAPTPEDAPKAMGASGGDSGRGTTGIGNGDAATGGQDTTSAGGLSGTTGEEASTRAEAGFTGADASRMEADAQRERAARIALRVAQDKYETNDEEYTAVGLETAFLRRLTFMENLRGELGATGSAMTSADLVDVYSAHALAGPAYEVMGFVIGGRLLGGAVYDSNNKWRGDTGGEFRLGYENDALSIFAGVGRTRLLSTRLGLDVGLLL